MSAVCVRASTDLPYACMHKGARGTGRLARQEARFLNSQFCVALKCIWVHQSGDTLQDFNSFGGWVGYVCTVQVCAHSACQSLPSVYERAWGSIAVMFFST